MEKLQHPIEILQQLEARSRATAKGLPQQTDQQALWSGIGFRIADYYMISPVTQIHEIQRYPRLTTVPGTHPWIRGLANFRGTLLPIVDMQSYFGYPAIKVHSQSRILVIQQENLVVGLLVTDIIGLKNFKPEDRVSRSEKLDERIEAYIRGAFQQQGVTWYLFDMKALTSDPQFYQVTA